MNEMPFDEPLALLAEAFGSDLNVLGVVAMAQTCDGPLATDAATLVAAASMAGSVAVASGTLTV